MERKIYSIGELNRSVRFLLENDVGVVDVEGEISRLTRHGNGHWYFTLKDETAAVSCAMFRQQTAGVPFSPADGMKIRCSALVSLYEPRGAYQLIVRTMEEAGKGSLQVLFEQRKAALAAEGLFDTERKKPLPRLPRRIGLVTSPTGAAVRDLIQVLTRRFPRIEILLAPVTVQGASAAGSIASAIDYLNTSDAPPLDLLIVGRGGGSLEDLWAFNEEGVVRAVAASHIPVISAVGHEIDFTLCDFAADARAPTPSAAAEMAVPVQAELEERITLLRARLTRSLEHRARVLRERIPSLERTMAHSLQNGVRQTRQRIDEAAAALARCLQERVAQQRLRIPVLQQTLRYRMEQAVSDRRQTLARLEAQLRSLSPLGVLDRGYSITFAATGEVLRDPKRTKPGEVLTTRLARGEIQSTVTHQGETHE